MCAVVSPNADSFLRPYFTNQEIANAVAHGVPNSFFSDTAGSQVDLVKNPMDEGYLCPAFDVQSGRCGIYDVRPLDCQLYPLALMWDASGREVLLGWDSKCPFMRDAVPSHAIREYAGNVVAMSLTDETIVEEIVAHPRLIGRFQDDVIVLKALPHLTARLSPERVDPQLRPLTWSDAPQFAKALERAQVIGHDTPAAFAFPYHYIWTSLLPYWWMEIDQTLFLFAESPDGWFMPLPPLGARPLGQAVERGVCDHAVAERAVAGESNRKRHGVTKATTGVRRDSISSERWRLSLPSRGASGLGRRPL